MTLSNGREILMMPGPTTVPDEVLGAMHRPAIDIYAGPLLDMTNACIHDLKTLFGTRHDVYIFASNGHGAWESALTNCLSPGDKVLVLESGLFALGWGEMARKLGLEVEILKGDWRRAVDIEALAERLAQDRTGEIQAVLVTQIDTASGSFNRIPAIRQALYSSDHDALLMVDVIASLGSVPFLFDDWGVDVAVGAAQKGLMMTPGLSFVAAGPKAKARHLTIKPKTSYWDWSFRDGPELYNKFGGTCPEHLIFGLRKALNMITAEGLASVHRRHALMAGAVRQAVSVWAQAGALEFNIREYAERSDSVTVVTLDDSRCGGLLDFCRETCGVVLGITLGETAGRGFRIAHMGHFNAATVFGGLSAIETGLAVLGIPHEPGGVSAATAWLATTLKPQFNEDGR